MDTVANVSRATILLQMVVLKRPGNILTHQSCLVLPPQAIYDAWGRSRLIEQFHHVRRILLELDFHMV